MDIFSIFDPLKHFGGESYLRFFRWLFETMFNGWLARMLGFICLGFSFWFWVRIENMARGLAFFALALLFGYGWVLFRIMGIVQ
ncbi:hypothetical protein [Thermodesulfovibrio thiophilus]|uniref:hypothetical protein n=1 Tax=Thermodesulfovibrio thiophilus TaxID=340095 RepID=UPI0004914828|nr:hypothetical protein [Thermodesulfovibrio thiophilus]